MLGSKEENISVTNNKETWIIKRRKRGGGEKYMTSSYWNEKREKKVYMTIKNVRKNVLGNKEENESDKEIWEYVIKNEGKESGKT